MLCILVSFNSVTEVFFLLLLLKHIIVSILLDFLYLFIWISEMITNIEGMVLCVVTYMQTVCVWLLFLGGWCYGCIYYLLF